MGCIIYCHIIVSAILSDTTISISQESHNVSHNHWGLPCDIYKLFCEHSLKQNHMVTSKCAKVQFSSWFFCIVLTQFDFLKKAYEFCLLRCWNGLVKCRSNIVIVLFKTVTKYCNTFSGRAALLQRNQPIELHNLQVHSKKIRIFFKSTFDCMAHWTGHEDKERHEKLKKSFTNVFAWFRVHLGHKQLKIS